MLTDRLQSDMAALTSSLKTGLQQAVAGTGTGFSGECLAIAETYGQGMKPSGAEVYQAALLYLQGRIGEDIEYLYDLVAFGLYTRIEAVGNRCIAEDHRKLDILLRRYRYEAQQGELWETTWQGVMQSYFAPPLRYSEQETIRRFLVDTYPKLLETITYRPLWLKTIEGNLDLFGSDPCGAYAERWLKGTREDVRHVAGVLQIAPQSWFWQELTRSALRFACSAPDADFKAMIPQALALIEEMPAFLDEDLATLLTRYSQCADKTAHDELKAFALRHWKSPKRRTGTAWEQVRENVWQMALEWVGDDDLRLFFERISARLAAGGDRLSSWLRYIKWTRFVADYTTGRGNRAAVARLFEAEEAALRLSDEGWESRLDAFLARINSGLTKA